MYKLIKDIENRILNGGSISYEESLQLINTSNDDIEHLFNSADKIRQAYMGNKADLCTIVNAKSGKCSENCKYCAQSIYYNTGVHEYKLLTYDNILEKALYVQNKGAHRISLVTSGRGVTDEDLKKLVEIYKRLKIDTDLKICASHGIITYEQALLLKSSGVDMYHHNLETGYKYYKNICTTHNYDDRIRTIDNLQKAGITVCSGGIIGMNETLRDRIDMAFELRRLNIKSIPINILSPIKGTPYGELQTMNPMEALKTMAVYRFVIPNAHIRYAGGRLALGNKQKIGLRGGVNSILTGDYLTTTGSSIENDIKMLLKLGYLID